MTNTWAKDLNPKYKPMGDIQSQLFLIAVMGGVTNKVNEEFLIQILNKRIEVMKLPISFSNEGKMAVLALTDRPGAVVMLLIDCLNAYEGKEVTPAMLADLYPTGFYDEPTMMRYADNYLKPQMKDGKAVRPDGVKWAEVY